MAITDNDILHHAGLCVKGVQIEQGRSTNISFERNNEVRDTLAKKESLSDVDSKMLDLLWFSSIDLSLNKRKHIGHYITKLTAAIDALYQVSSNDVAVSILLEGVDNSEYELEIHITDTRYGSVQMGYKQYSARERILDNNQTYLSKYVAQAVQDAALHTVYGCLVQKIQKSGLVED